MNYFKTALLGLILLTSTGCKNVLNQDQPTNNLLYTNNKLGISFKLFPEYNKNISIDNIIVNDNKITSSEFRNEFLQVFTKDKNQSIEEAILSIAKKEGSNPVNCKVVSRPLNNSEQVIHRLQLINKTDEYSDDEWLKIKEAEQQAQLDGGPFGGEYQKKAIQNERLLEECGAHASPDGLGTCTVGPASFISEEDKQTFIYHTQLNCSPSFWEDGTIELLM